MEFLCWFSLKKAFQKDTIMENISKQFQKGESRMGELIDAKEVAKRLGVSRKTVYTYAKTGKLPFIELTPRNYRFTREDVEEFLQKQRKVMRKDG